MNVSKGELLNQIQQQLIEKINSQKEDLIKERIVQFGFGELLTDILKNFKTINHMKITKKGLDLLDNPDLMNDDGSLKRFFRARVWIRKLFKNHAETLCITAFVMFSGTVIIAFGIADRSETDKSILINSNKQKDSINTHNESIVRKQDSIINRMPYIPEHYQRSYADWEKIMDSTQNAENISTIE